MWSIISLFNLVTNNKKKKIKKKKKSHVYIEDGYFEKLEEACEEEEDMLDMAFALKENSRLGCQIILTEELDGIVCRIPNATRNISNLK